jgi:hypothetical protein
LAHARAASSAAATHANGGAGVQACGGSNAMRELKQLDDSGSIDSWRVVGLIYYIIFHSNIAICLIQSRHVLSFHRDNLVDLIMPRCPFCLHARAE